MGTPTRPHHFVSSVKESVLETRMKLTHTCKLIHTNTPHIYVQTYPHTDTHFLPSEWIGYHEKQVTYVYSIIPTPGLDIPGR